MRCVSVYTDDFETFSNLFEQIVALDLHEDQEIEIDGILVNDAGQVPDNYLEKMMAKPDVVVMRDQERDFIVLQHGNLFEIFMPKVTVSV